MKTLMYTRPAFRFSICGFLLRHPSRPSRVFPHSARGFHATAPHPFLDECLVQTHTMINGLHDITGLSWAASIPLTGLVVAVVIRFPISLYVTSILRRQSEQVPQLLKYRDALQNEIMQENVGKDARYKDDLVEKTFKTHCNQVWKEKGIQHWKTSISIVKFPVWFAIMDCLRRMTGTHEGFPSLIGRSVTGRGGLDQTLNDTVLHLEPNLAIEGALWFQNLILPDPSLIVPFLVSCSMFACSYSGLGVHRLLPLVEDSTEEFFATARANIWLNRMRNIVTLAIAPATLQFPSALLLFWISNNLSIIGIGYLHTRWMRPKVARVAIEATKRNTKKQQYRGPKMQDLCAHKRGKK